MGFGQETRGGIGPMGGVLGTEIFAPLLLLCWLCCWPDDAKSDSSSSGKRRKEVVDNDSGSHRRASDFFSRRFASSAVSLHLPSTSGHSKQSLSAHRSHEEIRSRRKSHHETGDVETRYHSAPSVIDEVIHRRDWERSTRDLHIPLHPDVEHLSDVSLSPERAPRAEPESSSPELDKSDERRAKTCKKHYTNIKSSRKKQKEYNDDDKDIDVTETSNFYIGDEVTSLLTKTSLTDDIDYDDLLLAEERTKSVYKAKDAKQTINESIRSKERPKKLIPLEEHKTSHVFSYWLDEDIDQIDDRSGAVHHRAESCASIGRSYPPPSVDVVGYEGGACYLAETGSVPGLRERAAGPLAVGPAAVGPEPAVPLRARHASDGDILAPPLRPESGAFSESDLDLELDESEELPPSYHELKLCVSDHKETAI